MDRQVASCVDVKPSPESLHNGKGLNLEQKIDANVVQAYGQLFHDEAPLA